MDWWINGLMYVFNQWMDEWVDVRMDSRMN